MCECLGMWMCVWVGVCVCGGCVDVCVGVCVCVN